MSREITFKLILTGETEEAYEDVCTELVLEDFILRYWVPEKETEIVIMDDYNYKSIEYEK